MGTRVRRVLPALAVVAAACLAGCVPTETTDVAEVDDGGDAGAPEQPAPTFPDGEVPAEVVVDGLAHDLTTRPRDQDYWSPRSAEARCSAEQIVDQLGADRIVALGYRPGTPGASINDLALEDAERHTVVDAVAGCVDLEQAVGSILYGAGRIPASAASCVARGLGAQGARSIVEAWAWGRAVDPFEEGSPFATLLLGHAQVCISDTAFDWPDVRFPDDDPIMDSDRPAGTSDSPYVDDARRRRTSPPDGGDGSRGVGDGGPTPSTAAPTTTSTPAGDVPQA